MAASTLHRGAPTRPPTQTSRHRPPELEATPSGFPYQSHCEEVVPWQNGASLTGFSCALRFLPVSPALARGPLLSPLMASPPLLLSLPRPILCLPWLPLRSHQPVSATALVAWGSRADISVPRDRRSSPSFPPPHCSPLFPTVRETTASHFATTQPASPILPVRMGPLIPHMQKNPIHALEFLSPSRGLGQNRMPSVTLLLVPPWTRRSLSRTPTL